MNSNLPLLKKEVFIAIVFFSFVFGKTWITILAILFLLAYYTYTKQQKSSTTINKQPTIIDINKLTNMNDLKKKVPLGIGAVLLLWLLIASVTIIDAGETGVYSLFGKVREKELSSGLHLVIPLAKVTKMNIKTQDYTMSNTTDEGKYKGADAIAVLTKEGLDVALDMTVLYKLNEEKASNLYQSVGIQYDEVILRPAIRTIIRDVIAQYEAKDIYSTKREEAGLEIFNKLEIALSDRGVIIEQVLLRNVQLPARLTQSIQEKLQAEQEAQKYDFLLKTEKKEKERKVIEAEGQRDAQKIINESLSTNYLYYLYINQLKDLEGTVYVPTGASSGMPLFRNIGQ